MASHLVAIRLDKGNSDESSGRKEGATEEALTSESSYNIAERMLVETGMLKALPVRYEMAVRSMLLERAGKVSLLIKWQGTWLNCALVFCGR